MKNTVKGLLITAMITPVTLNAFGMGLSVPIMTNVEHNIDGYGNSKWKEDSISGFGLVLDSNIGKNKLYNWRLNLESNKIETEYGYKYDKNSFINTFGFSIFRNKIVRVFMGPRLEFGFINENTWNGFEFALSPVVGVNINLGSVISLGLDVDYKIDGLSTSTRSYDNYYYDNYNNRDETLSGMTTRFYLLFRFGERY